MLQMSRAEVIASLREDYNNNYFVSGTGSMEAYEPDCEFADPFASFRGTQRFKKNVGNLGGLAYVLISWQTFPLPEQWLYPLPQMALSHSERLQHFPACFMFFATVAYKQIMWLHAVSSSAST